MAACGAANWLLVGPATTKTMRLRKQQETREGRKYYDSGPKSEEMKALNARFGKLHGVSSLVNLVEVVVTVVYGISLARRFIRV